MTARDVRDRGMGRKSGRRLAIFGKCRPVLALALTAAVASGCSTDPQTFGLTRSQIEERSPFVAVPNSQAWVNAANTRSVLQRNLGAETEQKIGLSNASGVSGDNIILLRTRAGSSNLGRLRFEDLVARFGGLPHPFTNLGSGDLLEAQDEIGTYFWTGQSVGESTNCVLGIRRVDGGMRQLPGGAGIMDIIVRNCVNGSQQDALAPLLANSIGIAPGAGGADGVSRMLSPLAAPTGNLTPRATTGGQR
ncbi:hypothetical protein [Paracoccus sp. KR1-242]|uniref:hypothetical protein n=1 Tax=Paracoccus sp. KR1-242 TaxID=3410028 RepID=UPI003C0CD9AD